MKTENLVYITALHEEKGGFNFDNYIRNNHILSNKDKSIEFGHHTNSSKVKPISFRTRKTGTTICGIVTKEAIILGADTRATDGSIVAIKNCEKLKRLTDNIFIAGAGVSADLHHIGNMMVSRLQLLKLSLQGRMVRVITAVTMLQQLLFSYQGYLVCAIVLGGVDFSGPQLYKIFPHGSCDRLPFCAMGSGSLNALAVLESSYHDTLQLDEGKDVVCKAIQAGILNDLGSGGNCDLAIIPFDPKYFQAPTQIPSTKIRQYYKTQTRPFYLKANFPIGTTPTLYEDIQTISKLIVVDETPEDIDML